jgi:hypothetical protein
MRTDLKQARLGASSHGGVKLPAREVSTACIPRANAIDRVGVAGGQESSIATLTPSCFKPWDVFACGGIAGHFPEFSVYRRAVGVIMND